MAKENKGPYAEILGQIDARDLDEAGSILRKVRTANLKKLAILYRSIRNDTIQFQEEKTKEILLVYLSDQMADKISTRKESNVKMLIGVLCFLTAFLLCICMYFASQNEKKGQSKIQAVKEIYREDVGDENGVDEDSVIENSENDNGDQNSEVSDTETTSSGLMELYNMNSDLYGWITIDGTSIDYPVMQTTDNEYYLTRDFYKEEDTNGSLFLDYRNTSVSDTNLIIYGHNMRSGEMFGSLKKYEDYEYFQAYPNISFETLYGSYSYKIVAVCKGEVSYENEERFRYYNFISASSNEDLQEFWTNIKEHSIYDITYKFTENDHYMTLSTCSSFTENGRLYIVAVRED